LNRDLILLSRSYLAELPRNKAYIYKYFPTEFQEAFVKYVHAFGEYSQFMEHTGHRASFRWLNILYERLIKLEAVHKKAKQDMDFEFLAIIESGQYTVIREFPEFERRDDEHDDSATQPAQPEVE